MENADRAKKIKLIQQSEDTDVNNYSKYIKVIFSLLIIRSR